MAQSVTSRQNDGDELVPLVEEIRDTTGEYPTEIPADAGYGSEWNIEAMEKRKIDPYIATGRQKHGRSSPTSEEDKKSGPRTVAMREKLKQGGFEGPYRLRKQVVEPVFGQIKEARGFRQFLHRGLANVRRDWSMVCTVHNLLRLFKKRSATMQTAGSRPPALSPLLTHVDSHPRCEERGP